MDPEIIVKLDQCKPRPYQIPILKAFDNGFKRVVVAGHRRFGKDIVGMLVTVRQALQRVGTIFYLFPLHKQVRDAIWNGLTIDGKPYLSLIPDALIARKRNQDMSIELINGSIIKFTGSDRFDALRGTNPIGIVFSEYAYQHPQVLPTVLPIINANGGWMLFLSTPFGENHFYQLYKAAESSPDWFAYMQTVDDTQIINHETIQKEIELGVMSPDMARQEYWCDFTVGAIGAYYATYLNRIQLEGHITAVDWESGFKVHTAWDLGMADETVIIFFQLIGQSIRIIDLYSNSNVGLEHYINVVQSKPYTYGKHIAPHDIRVRDYSGGGKSRWDKAKDLGITFTLAPDMTIIDGIESVRSAFNRLWIDEKRGGRLISALRDYRKEYDPVTKRYKPKPRHDANSHYADALRYLCISVHLLYDGLTYDDIQKLKQDAYKGPPGLPGFFTDPHTPIL
jgi:phage terminase large subunit